MPENKTYLFDFDYTLADSSRGIVICFRNVLTRHGHTDITDESIKRTIGKTLEDSFSILTGITDKNTLISYKKEYVKEADIHMTANTKFFPETVAVLKALKKRGAQIGIISTKYRYRIHEMVDQHFPNKFFDIIIGREDVKKCRVLCGTISINMWRSTPSTGMIYWILLSCLSCSMKSWCGSRRPAHRYF